MELLERKAYNDINLKIEWGNMVFNILYIRYSPPKPNRIVKYHCHSSYELHFIPFGNGILMSEGKEYVIEPNHFYLTGPHIYHEQKSSKNDAMAEYCINFEMTQQKLGRNKSPHFLQDEISEMTQILRNTHFWYGHDTYNSIELFHKIFKEFDQQLIGFYSNIRNYISEIIINTVRCYSDHRKAQYVLPKKSLDEMREQLLSGFFLNNQNKALDLEMIARTLGLSKRQTSRIIRKYYHVNFKEKQIDDKMKNAKMLLLTTQLSINEIAEKAGFSSASYFNRSFREHENSTPTLYRAAHKEKTQASLTL